MPGTPIFFRFAGILDFVVTAFLIVSFARAPPPKPVFGRPFGMPVTEGFVPFAEVEPEPVAFDPLDPAGAGGSPPRSVAGDGRRSGFGTGSYRLTFPARFAGLKSEG